VQHGFPHAMALIGLRDVRDYKIRLRPDSDSLGTASPFNIKAKSLFVDQLTAADIRLLLNQHTEATGQVFEADAIACIAHLSGGQAWLVNALANEIVAEILNDDPAPPVTEALVWQAKEALILRRDTHLDSLVDKLKEERVRLIITAIIDGHELEYDRYNDALGYCQDLGLITAKPPIGFANPIYREIIPRVMSYHWQLSIPADYADPCWYVKNGKLDMEALLQAFQSFYREHSEAWLEKYDFREVGRQLLLMAFLQRIVNGGGRIEREMAIGNGRADLVIDYAGERFVLELKLKHHPTLSQATGLRQLGRYLDRLGLTRGYLILFERDAKVAWEQRLRWETVKEADKTLIVVGL